MLTIKISRKRDILVFTEKKTIYLWYFYFLILLFLNVNIMYLNVIQIVRPESSNSTLINESNHIAVYTQCNSLHKMQLGFYNNC